MWVGICHDQTGAKCLANHKQAADLSFIGRQAHNKHQSSTLTEAWQADHALYTPQEL